MNFYVHKEKCRYRITFVAQHLHLILWCFLLYRLFGAGVRIFQKKKGPLGKMKKREGQRERRRAVKSVAQRKGNSETFRDFYYMNFSGETLAIHSPPQKNPPAKTTGGRKEISVGQPTIHVKQRGKNLSNSSLLSLYGLFGEKESFLIKIPFPRASLRHQRWKRLSRFHLFDTVQLPHHGASKSSHRADDRSCCLSRTWWPHTGAWFPATKDSSYWCLSRDGRLSVHPPPHWTQHPK